MSTLPNVLGHNRPLMLDPLAEEKLLLLLNLVLLRSVTEREGTTLVFWVAGMVK